MTIAELSKNELTEILAFTLMESYEVTAGAKWDELKKRASTYGRRALQNIWVPLLIVGIPHWDKYEKEVKQTETQITQVAEQLGASVDVDTSYNMLKNMISVKLTNNLEANQYVDITLDVEGDTLEVLVKGSGKYQPEFAATVNAYINSLRKDAKDEDLDIKIKKN